MDQIILFALLGLGSGALIAGLAVSLVLCYRGSGIINLATGAVATVAAYAFWSLTAGVYGPRFSTPLAVVCTLIVSALVGVLMEFLAFRPLRTSSPVAKLVASLGLLLIGQAVVLLAFGPNPQTVPSILPGGTVQIFTINVPITDFILAGIVLLIAVVLSAAYRWTRFGLETKAAFESEVSAMWVGLSPTRLSLTNTVLASLVAGLVGLLVAPITALDPQLLPLQVVPALAAALFANFTSFIGACLVGLGIGALENILYYLSTQTWFPTDHGAALPGVQELVVFILVVIAVFLRGSRLPRRGDFVERPLPPVPVPGRMLRPAVGAFLFIGLLLIVFPYDFRQALMNSIIAAGLILSLVVVTGFMGQVSVVQLALSGGAGFVMAHFDSNLGIGFPADAIVGVCVATVIGVAIGFSALRVRGVQLAVVTMAGAVAIQQFWFANATLGAGLSGANVAQPSLFGLQLGNQAPFRGLDGNIPSPILGFVVLAITIGLCLLVGHLRRTHVGQQMVVARANERAAAGVGINVRAVKLVAFTVGSFIAGVAGVMYAYNFGSISADRFSAVTALSLIAFAYVGGITMTSGAVVAGLISVEALIPYAWEKWLGLSGTWALLFGGVFLIFNLIFYPGGVAGTSYEKRRLKARRAASNQATPPRRLLAVVPRIRERGIRP